LRKGHYDHFAPDEIPATHSERTIVYQNMSLKQDIQTHNPNKTK